MSKSTRATAHALVAAIAMVVLGFAIASQTALAGRYHVYSCRTPNERAAPVDGWMKSTVPANAGSVVAEDTCASGGALLAAIKDGAPHEVGTSAEWELGVPGGERLAAATLWRAGEAAGGDAQNATYDFQIAGPARSEVFDECVYLSKCTGWIGAPEQSFSLSNFTPVPSSHLGSDLYVTSACGGLPGYSCPEGKNDPNGYAAAVYLYAADVVLEDSSQPTIVPNSVGGELADASTVSGKASLLFTVEDEGSGVRDAVVSVDGTPLPPTQLDSNGGRCADLGEATDGLPGYEYMQPCAPVVSGDVQLDTASLANGVHRLVVAVEDAAGNATTVLDRQIDVVNAVSTAVGGAVGAAGVGISTGVDAALTGSNANGSPAGAANGSPASSPALLTARWSATAKAAYAARWGSAARIVGRLTTPSGTPIGGAAIEASAISSSQGAKARSIGMPHTGADGRFSLELSPRSSSERIVLVYRAHYGDAAPAATGTLTLVVPAHVQLKVVPHVSHAHGTIRFGGVLAGAPMPSGGKQLALQARSAGRPWQTFRLVSTDAHGRFRASYRFRYGGPIVYRFRAISPHEADFPFGRGVSNVVRVRER